MCVASIILKENVGLKKTVMPPLSPCCDFPLPPMAVRHHEESELAVDHRVAPPPPLYKVLLLNDDYTPMEFVVKVLEGIFFLSREQATRVMLKVHNEGVGVAGIYPRDVAEAKVHQVTEYAQSQQHPLQCVMEEDR
jgi:ATP-dependent Clp protease adaptor protein ClpS